MQNHPNVWGKLPGNARYGAYGPDHSWHEADWWHQNNPNWMYQNHPEWAQNHPDWQAATATSTRITNGTIAAGGTIITPIGSISIIPIGTSIRTSIRSQPKSTSTRWKSSTSKHHGYTRQSWTGRTTISPD